MKMTSPRSHSRWNIHSITTENSIFFVKNNNILLKHCINDFAMIFTINLCEQHHPIDHRNGDVLCFLCSMN